jgi:ATP-dependent Clp protease protease subunit
MTEAIYNIPIECKGDTADVLIYDQIGQSYFEDGLTAKAFAEQLREHKNVKTINVRINSPGGNVFDATAIYNTLRNHGAKIISHVEGAALSAASLVAMAGDEIRMAANGYMMIHDPSGAVRGKSTDMRKQADMLDRVKATLVDTYASRTKHPKDEIARMMSEETWLGAEDAKAKGFADTIAEASNVVASFDPNQFSNVPQDLRVSLQKEPIPMADPKAPEAPKAATVQELKAACPNADAVFLMSQLEASATVDNAAKAWMTELSNRLAAKDVELAKSKAAPPAAPPAPQAAGVEPLPAGNPKPTAAGTAEATSAFEDLVVAEMKLTNSPRNVAFAKVCRKNPELREQFVAAHNQENGGKRR